MSTSCTDVLAFLVPSEYPTALAAGDGAVGYSYDLANVRNTHRFFSVFRHIADVIERMALCHKEVTAPPFQFTHATAREPANPLALLVIDVVPVLRLLDIRYLLPLQLLTSDIKSVYLFDIQRYIIMLTDIKPT